VSLTHLDFCKLQAKLAGEMMKD